MIDILGINRKQITWNDHRLLEGEDTSVANSVALACRYSAIYYVVH